MKFTITIYELLEAYDTKKQSDDTYLCHFIQYNLLPRKSIFNRIYFLFLGYKPTSQLEFTQQVANEFNCKIKSTLEQMLHNHPDFKDIPAYQINTHDYRIQILTRMKELKPNLTFTFNF